MCDRVQEFGRFIGQNKKPLSSFFVLENSVQRLCRHANSEALFTVKFFCFVPRFSPFLSPSQSVPLRYNETVNNLKYQSQCNFT